MIGRFSNLQDVLDNDEIIEPNIYTQVDSVEDGVLYVKRDFLFRPGEWRGVHIDSGVITAKKHNVRTIVVSHSDYLTSRIDLLRVKAISGVKRVMGTNTIPFRNFSFSLPLGLTSDELTSDVHHLFSDHSLLSLAMDQVETKQSFDGSIYANFNYKTNVKKRLPLLEKLPSLPLEVLKHEPDISAEGRVSYLRNLRRASLVLCPEGNGVDTHRLWETLYMGGTPVVLRNPALSTMLDVLPVIQLNSWTELQNSSRIEELWFQISKFNWDSEMLYKRYWQKKITDSI